MQIVYDKQQKTYKADNQEEIITILKEMNKQGYLLVDVDVDSKTFFTDGKPLKFCYTYTLTFEKDGSN